MIPVKGTLGGVGGIVERAKRGLEAKDRHGAGPLLGDARQVAWSHPLQRFCGVCMSRRLPMRPKILVGLLAAPGAEPDETALDDDKTFALCDIQGPQEVRRRQAADLDRELNVELVAQDRQSPDQFRCGASVSIHLCGQ